MADVTIERLRAEAPSFHWTAERHGMGWRYRGLRREHDVKVYAVARLCGEDEFWTEWRVDDGQKAQSYAAWWIEEADRG